MNGGKKSETAFAPPIGKPEARNRKKQGYASLSSLKSVSIAT